MNRAQELRARKKEVDLNHTGDISPSPVSQSELQRQRRSRQLEATQKLLDAAGQLGSGIKTANVISGMSNVALNPDDERPIGGSGALQNASLVGNESKKEILQPSVREMPLEGKGRGRGHVAQGRGRGRSNNVSSFTDGVVGDVLIPRISSASSKGGEVVVDIKSSRSSITTGTHSSNSSQSINSRSRRESIDDVVLKQLQSYLKGRRVPVLKEGDCTKLTNLRQRLVARRRKREMSNTLGGAPIGRVIQSSQSQRSVGSSTKEGATERSSHTDPSRVSGNSRASNQGSLLDNQAGLNPNEYTAKDYQQSRETNSRFQDADDTEASPPVSTPGRQSKDDSTDEKSNDSDVVSNDDEEASVVDIELIQCDNCKRKFAPKIYEKHYANGQPKCIQMAVTKRPVYNAKAVRIGNNDTLDQKDQMLANHAPYGDAAKSSSKKKGGSKKNSKWREESEAFREALRANRLVSQEETKKKEEKKSSSKKHGKSRKSKA